MEKIDKEIVNKIIELRLNGSNIEDIKNKTGISKGSISKYLNQYNIGCLVNDLGAFIDSKIEKIDIIHFLAVVFNPNVFGERFIIKEYDFLYEQLLKLNEHKKRLKFFDEKQIQELQKRYNELQSLEKLSKETHISYDTLKKYIVLKEKGSRSENSNYLHIKKHRINKKEILVNYKGGKCIKCGYDNCMSALEFHHVNPSNKLFNISGKFLQKPIDELKQEADKCILLCSNCHKEIHSGYFDISDLKFL